MLHFTSKAVTFASVDRRASNRRILLVLVSFMIITLARPKNKCNTWYWFMTSNLLHQRFAWPTANAANVTVIAGKTKKFVSFAAPPSFLPLILTISGSFRNLYSPPVISRSPNSIVVILQNFPLACRCPTYKHSIFLVDVIVEQHGRTTRWLLGLKGFFTNCWVVLADMSMHNPSGQNINTEQSQLWHIPLTSLHAV